jgi:hypothetical protein
MKTIASSLLLLGLIASSASAQWCPPGVGYQRPTHGRAVVPVDKPQPPAVIEPAPAPNPEPVPQK